MSASLETIRSLIGGYPPDTQLRIETIAAVLRKFLAQTGGEGVLALTLVMGEFATQPEQGESDATTH